MQVELTRPRPVARAAGYQQVQRGQNQNLRPFSAPLDEIEAYNNFQLCINEPTKHLPSVLAKLNNNVVKSSPTIQMINQIFNIAIEDYLGKFAVARDRDLEKTLHPSARDGISDFRDAVATGAQRRTRDIPNIIIIRNITGLIFPLAGAFDGMINQASYTEEKINLENSENRQKWLNEVRILEEHRKNITVKLINERVSILITDIKENSDTVDMSWIAELQALDQLNQYLNPDKPLLVGKRRINEYVATIGNEEMEALAPQEITTKQPKTPKILKASSKNFNRPKEAPTESKSSRNESKSRK